MDKEQKATLIRSWPVYLVLLIFMALSIWVIANRDTEKRVCFRPKTAEEVEEIVSLAQAEKVAEADIPTLEAVDGEGIKPLSPAKVEKVDPAAAIASLRNREAKLLEIVQQRRTWSPVWTSWYGKVAPDFTFTDITGVTSRLSDYRVKEVIVHYWATWCPACKTQRPDLIKLRGSVDKTDLKIIAISNEGTSLLQRDARSNGINYTLTSIKGRQLAPFGNVNMIPVSFFIDKQGRIKIIAQGAIMLDEMQKILRVE